MPKKQTHQFPFLLKKARSLNSLLIIADIAFYGEHGTAMSASQIAQRTHISRRTIEPILQTLSHHKILTSVRGPHGGYRLRADAAHTSLLRIIELTHQHKRDEDKDLRGGSLYTELIDKFWQECNKKILDELHKVTIDDLVQKAHQLGIQQLRQYPLTFSI